MEHKNLLIIWDMISALPTLVPLLLLPFIGIASAHVWKPLKRTEKNIESWWGIEHWVALIVIVFILLDWGILAGLPRLGLSFGPVGLPLLGMISIRFLLLICLVKARQWSRNIWPKIDMSYGVFSGVFILLILNLSVLALEIQGMYFEPFDLRVTELDLTGPALLPDRPLRLVQLSDLHIERITKREQEMIKVVDDYKPDIIVLTGDYLNTSYLDDPKAIQDARTILAQLGAPYGVYAVVAKPVDHPEVISALFEGLDIMVLEDELYPVSLPMGEIYLVGVTYTQYLQRERDENALVSLMSQVPMDGYSILLYHTPDIVAVAAAEEVDLYLAGHTHGGQIRLPLYGAVITASEFGKKYEQGRYNVGPTTLYVSRGLGMEGKGAPRARFLCPPEIVVVNLRSK